MESSIYKLQGNTLTDSNEENNLLSYVCFCLEQAREFLRLSGSSTPLTKPHLLFCSFSLFAKAFICAKAGEPRDEPTHGLTTRGTREETESLLEREVVVKEKGLFQSFHLCFADSQIKSGTRFRLRDLLGCIDGLGFPKVLELDEPSAHLAITFLLSMICRYEPLRWMKGKEEKWMKRYIEIAEQSFPSFIEEALRQLGFKNE
ncbi:hypothetical protein H5T87_05055 [bacterium]|nr:hypothetical protein [bacterium]